jgi:hypothetical protein
MSAFQDCVVSFIDLDNVSEILFREGRRGVRIMRDLHRLVACHAPSLSAQAEICFWQDSVLLLGHVTKSSESYRRVMSDVIRLKDTIQKLHACHAVCVKGQSFSSQFAHSVGNRPRIIYLSASSLAFSNAFRIERELGSHVMDWYIDSRITRRCRFRCADRHEKVELFPPGSERQIHLYRGSPR